ncbi:MAG TPA: ParB/RepB/Spo0J family partition protein [Solirubrobacteraceae bacterium]
MTTTTPTTAVGELRLPLDDIRVRDNVRDLDLEHVDALAASIALRGVLVPLIVRQVHCGYELVAGYHRIAACRQLRLADVPVVVRDRDGSSADSAAENVTRKALSALEEARAVQAMLDEGYTPDGAAQALGWTRQLVSARAKILRLPPVGQQLVGDGRVPVGAIDTLLAITDVSPAIGRAVVDAIAAGDIAGSQLAGNTSWAIGQALRGAPKGTFGAYLNHLDAHDLQALRLGKKTDALIAEAEQLHTQLDRYAYGPPTFRFCEADVDQARAAGVLIEPERGTAIITDRGVYRELAKQAISRTTIELRQRAADKASTTRSGKAARARTPREQLDVEHRASLRELARQAHGVNLDLGSALLQQLAIVAADDLDVARFFCFGLLGPTTSSYLSGGEHVARTIAANGLRLVLDEQRTSTTPTLKSGKAGKTKIAYADAEDALAWLWRFIAGATTAGELYGRTLVVFAAQHYASQLVLAASQRRASVLPRSHNDTARKAFERITKKLLPASHKALARALKAEASAYHKRVAELDAHASAAATGSAAPAGKNDDVDDTPVQAVAQDDVDEDLDTGDVDEDAD